MLDSSALKTSREEPLPALGAALALTGLAAGVLLVFWPLVSKQYSLYGDYASYYYPFAQFLAHSLAQGELPLWNPFLVQGYHFAANPQTQVFYPPAWLLALLVKDGRLPYYALEMFTLSHYLVAGFFTFLYLRRLGASALAAFFAGQVFILGGLMWAQMMHKAMVETVAWLPAVLYGLEGLLQRPRLSNALGTALAAALMFLGGFIPLVYLCVPFLVIYVLLGLRRQPAGRGGAWARLGLLGLTGALALGLVAVQLLPTLELSQLTYRHEFGLKAAAAESLWPSYLLSAFVPMAFFGSTSYSLEEVHFFLGLTPLLLAGLALAPPWRRGTWFWTGAVVAALLVALGTHTPLYGFLWRHLPGMEVTRVPGRYVLMVDLGLAVLAGLGAARLMEPGRKRQAVGLWLLGLYLALGLAGLWARWRMQGSGFDPLALGLAPDVANQVTKALVFWFLGLGLLALTRVERLPRGLVMMALLGLSLIEIMCFPRQLMWEQRRPEAYYPQTPEVTFLHKELPPGRLGIDQQLTGVPDYQRNAGAVYNLPTTAIFDTVGDARLWHFMGQNDARLTADLLDQRYLSSAQPHGKLPLSKYRAFDVWPGQPVRLDLAGLWEGEVRQVGLVSSLAFGEKAAQGEPVAEIVLQDAEGQTSRLSVRAGVDTSEWSVDNPHHPTAHQAATVVRSWKVPGEGYQGHAFKAAWELDLPLAAQRIEVRSLHPNAVLKVEALTLNGEDLLRLGKRYRSQGPELYRNRYALARARLLRSWRVAPGQQESMRATLAADLKREVVLEHDPRFPEANTGDRPAAADAVRVTSEELNRVVLEADAVSPAILFLADTFYPGWQVTVDGRPAELLRADYCLRAVALGPGAHRVVFFFRPTHWGLAWGISLASLGLALVLGLGAWLGRRRRRHTVLL